MSNRTKFSLRINVVWDYGRHKFPSGFKVFTREIKYNNLNLLLLKMSACCCEDDMSNPNVIDINYNILQPDILGFIKFKAEQDSTLPYLGPN